MCIIKLFTNHSICTLLCMYVNISEEDVLEALNSLDPDKSSGIDTIGPRVLKSVPIPYVDHCIIYFQLASATIPFHLTGVSMLSLLYTSLVTNPW